MLGEIGSGVAADETAGAPAWRSDSIVLRGFGAKIRDSSGLCGWI
jgi:hypothetical protein